MLQRKRPLCNKLARQNREETFAKHVAASVGGHNGLFDMIGFVMPAIDMTRFEIFRPLGCLSLPPTVWKAYIPEEKRNK